jgi:hypothetical protein
MSDRPLSFADSGRFEICCHHSPPTDYPEETHATVQICIPQRGAAYSVTRSFAPRVPAATAKLTVRSHVTAIYAQSSRRGGKTASSARI